MENIWCWISFLLWLQRNDYESGEIMQKFKSKCVILIPIISLFLIFVVDYFNFKYYPLWINNSFYEGLLLEVLQNVFTATGLVFYILKYSKTINRMNMILWIVLWLLSYLPSRYTVYLMFSIGYYILWFSTFIILEVVQKTKSDIHK